MEFIKQDVSLPIRNIDVNTQADLKKRHGILLPNSIRCLIVGPSNCGKTNVMLSLIEHPNGLNFENIYIYSKSLFQPKYEYLKSLISPIKGMGYFTYSSNDDVICPSDAKENSIFIFDDIACENQNNIRNFFCMGRHKSVDSFYLCQTYTHIPKHLIRDNSNFLVVFKQDDLNLKNIYSDHINTDMSLKDFRYMCSECWKNKYGFIVIDKDSPINKGRYRKGFDEFIKIN